MIPDLAGKQIVSVGMARSGMAAAEFLWKRGVRVTLSDSRPAIALESAIQFLNERNIEYEAGGHSKELFDSADLIVVSPGVPLSLPVLRQAAQKGKRLISEIELASRYLRGQVIAITGTNGKTTTTALVGEILRTAGVPTQVGGNIGTPLISLVESSSDDTWSVVELSSFQLEAVPTFRPHIAVILNITPDHLDRYASFQEYTQAKLNIFENQVSSDFAVLNHVDSNLRKAAAKIRSQVAWFSGSREVQLGAYAMGGRIVYNSGKTSEEVMACAEVPLKGLAHTSRASDMADAVRRAYQEAEPGDTVLLAPACASFDMFQNYEHRGREFKAAVGRLQGSSDR